MSYAATMYLADICYIFSIVCILSTISIIFLIFAFSIDGFTKLVKTLLILLPISVLLFILTPSRDVIYEWNNFDHQKEAEKETMKGIMR